MAGEAREVLVLQHGACHLTHAFPLNSRGSNRYFPSYTGKKEVSNVIVQKDNCWAEELPSLAKVLAAQE